MDCSNKYFRQIVEDPRYANDPPRHVFPLFESLKLCIDRTLPYWECNIIKDVSRTARGRRRPFRSVCASRSAYTDFVFVCS